MAASTPSFSNLTTKLSTSVFLCEPSEQNAANFSLVPAPKLVILCTWMIAASSHITKYILGYRTLYPSARILIIRSTTSDLTYRSRKTQYTRLKPAVSTILSTVPATAESTKNPQMILHTFSNGGAHMTRNLRHAYGLFSPINRKGPFPPYISIFDSCPGRSTFRRAVLAMSLSVPKSGLLHYPLLLLVYILAVCYWLFYIPLGIPDIIEKIRWALNDPGLMTGERRRCYIFSKEDAMVGWEYVVEHADEAKEKGFNVRLEEFVGSGHCAHARVGGAARYWAIVREMWQDAESGEKA